MRARPTPAALSVSLNWLPPFSKNQRTPNFRSSFECHLGDGRLEQNLGGHDVDLRQDLAHALDLGRRR